MKNNKLTNFIAVFSLSLLLGATAFSQTTLVEWNFPLNPDDAVADGGIAANAARIISTVGANAPTFATSGATTNSARATGWDNGSGTKYWTVSFSTTGFSSIQFSSAQRGSNTGPRDFKVQYSLNNTTWTDVAGATITVADNYTTGVLTAVALPAATNNQANVYLRWIMTSNTAVNGTTVASAGAANIDNILVTALAPLAGEVFVGGRVMDVRGNPIANAVVTLSGGPLTQSRTVRTSGFGYFGFSTVSVGNTYLISVSHARFNFDQPTLVINLNDEQNGLLFTGTRFFGTR